MPAVAELPGDLHALLTRFQEGNRSALARAISLVENRRGGFEAFLHALHAKLGHAHRIGITGPPGAGKSTLSFELAKFYRTRGERVGVIAVDPTSPFTGGALLGDRIRMNEIALDDGVFIRSMASRGSSGGLATTTKEVADVMDAFGFDRVIIETVGVGQSELDIAAAADSTVVVLVPESGDSIQAMKAGLMEIADLFVINKSDRPGADRITREIQMMLHLRLGKALKNVPAYHGVDLKRVGKQARAAPENAPIGTRRCCKPLQKTGRASLARGHADRHRTWLRDSGSHRAVGGAPGGSGSGSCGAARNRWSGPKRVGSNCLTLLWPARGGLETYAVAERIARAVKGRNDSRFRWSNHGFDGSRSSGRDIRRRAYATSAEQDRELAELRARLAEWEAAFDRAAERADGNFSTISAC
jgi:LAO/AO transport system kinase